MDLEVKAFMSGTPVSIEPEASALAALDLMTEHGIRHLPVVEGGGRVCGVLSFDDLRAALPISLSLRAPLSVEERRELTDYAVGEVMTYGPATIRYDHPLEEAAQQMIEGRFGCLPVVDEQGRLDGIITETDLLHALVTLLWSDRRNAGTAPARRDLATSLAEELAHLTERLAAYEESTQRLTEEGREVPLDVGDRGSQREAGHLTEELAELAARRVRAIEHALERQRQGALAVCERCSGRIAEARLRALPGATLCIRCARQAEQGG
jgi:CBS domain-containing protein/RNA polymerase-binding transcription factor DksA